MNTTTDKDVEHYIKRFDHVVKKRLESIRALIREIAPSAHEIISYGIPAFTFGGRAFIYYAAWKEHISIYPYSSKITLSPKEATLYAISKGTLQIPHDAPLPLALMKKIIRFRMKERLESN